MDKDKNNFGERLRELFPTEPYRIIAKQIGASKSVITNYMKGEIPKESILKNISELKHVNMEWLRYGKEPKYSSDLTLEATNNGKAENPLVAIPQTADALLLNYVTGNLDQLRNIIGNLSLKQFLIEQVSECTRLEFDSLSESEAKIKKGKSA